ncbi:unnamed protein product [Owenia fusiformis]|uniref:AP complex subunit sigma n=1 Tax=Owenia fusiformis TaxID=6347 RepID=A0A8S4PF30_OWEFU|nr:unnamed protein product [Owenia fusiformis]
MIDFLLLVNKQGQLRLEKQFSYKDNTTKSSLISNVVRESLTRGEKQCSFFSEKGGTKVVYKKYGALCFILGVSEDENELAILEFIHCIVETLDQYFQRVFPRLLLCI